MLQWGNQFPWTMYTIGKSRRNKELERTLEVESTMEFYPVL